MRLLLVEDDPILGNGLCTALRNDGYTVDWIKDGVRALQALETDEFVLIILDLGLPGMDGLDVLWQAREKNIEAPILILTARGNVEDRVQGLDLGADDYLTKPFDLDELQARVRSLLRRSHGRSTPQIKIGELAINPENQTVIYKNENISLSQKEFAILRYLAENKNRIISRTKLEEQLYGWDQSVSSNALEVHIHNLRKKLDSQLIKTIRGAGYQFTIAS